MKKILAYLRRKTHNIWEPIQRNFNEAPLAYKSILTKEDAAKLPYKDAHADHVVLKSTGEVMTKQSIKNIDIKPINKND